MAAIDQPGFEAGDNTVIWRYMAADGYRDLLSGTLYFAAAHQFEDQFEGAITQAQFARRQRQAERLFPGDLAMQQRSLEGTSSAFADLRRLTKINCWHARARENIAMWERYRAALTGGVAVATTVGALKQSLQTFRLKPEYGEEPIVIGCVRYLDYGTDKMTERGMLEVFLHKRIEYADENEVRALLSLRMASEFGVPVPDDGAVVTVDVRRLIHQTRVHPGATSDEVREFATQTRGAGCTGPVLLSALATRPIY